MEIRKDIPWLDWKYQGSSLWSIRSMDFNWTKTIKLLKPYTNKDWYQYIMLYKNGKWKTYRFHRLILSAFKWVSDLHCNHKNWVRDDNRIDNLEWVTRSENEKHKYKVLWREWINKGKFWWKHPFSRKVKQYTKWWELIKAWDSLIEASKSIGLVWTTWISKVLSWERKYAWGFIWKYNK